MKANLNMRHYGAVIVIEACDPFDSGRCSPGLREKLSELAESGNLWILLDMCGVTALDQTAARDLVVGGAALAMAGGDVKLMNVCATLQASLSAARLDTIFEIFDGELQAIRSFEMAQAARHRIAARRSELYWG